MSEVKVPGGWELGCLGDFCNIIGGGTPDRNNKEYWGGDIPWVSPTEITRNTTKYISETNEKITELGLEKSSAKLLPEGTLLMTSRASIGFVAINTVPMATNQGFQSLQCKKDVLADFLYQYIIWSRPQLERLAAGSTFAEISSANVKRLDVCFPPLPEQQKIATILTSVDTVIEKTRAQIDKLKHLKTAMMQELLTKGIGHTEFKDTPVGRIPKVWEVKTTGQLCRSIVPGRNKPAKMVGDIPWLTIGDLEELYVSNSKMGFGVTRQILKEAKGKTVPKMTVIMSCVGEFGISSVAKKEVVINQQLHGFVCGDYILPEYLCFILTTKKNEMLNLATQTTIAYMNKANCESILIPVPSITEQQEIVNVLQSIDTKIIAANQKLISVEQTKKALMQDLLTGKKRTHAF